MAQSDTTTGTAAGSSTTFTDLIDRARLLLNDESSATWDNELIATFLNDAIQDYSQHFPRTLTTTHQHDDRHTILQPAAWPAIRH